MGRRKWSGFYGMIGGSLSREAKRIRRRSVNKAYYSIVSNFYMLNIIEEGCLSREAKRIWRRSVNKGELKQIIILKKI